VATAAATNLPTNQDNHPVTMTTTVNQLSRSFGVVVRQIADLLMMLQDYHALVPNLSVVLDIGSTEVLELQVNVRRDKCVHIEINRQNKLMIRVR